MRFPVGDTPIPENHSMSSCDECQKSSVVDPDPKIISDPHPVSNFCENNSP
jgi:hypothetical protein